MRVLFGGEVPVDGQSIYVESDKDEYEPGRAEAFAGQGVGLCGAMMESALFLETGDSNDVQLTVTLHTHEPPIDERSQNWEEIVEVSFTPDSPNSRLLACDGEFSWELDLEEADYRVRYYASGMDQADRGESGPDGGAPDRYLLELWPSAPQPPRLLKHTSEHAAQSHEFARSLRAFAPRRPPAEVDAEATRREAEETARRLDQQALTRRRRGGADGCRARPRAACAAT